MSQGKFSPSSNAKRAAARHIDTVIIGAGAAGLAMSYELTLRGINHVLLERGEVANSWRHERWDSLKLLTPNWQTRLPGKAYAGGNADGFMAMPELIRFMEDYARLCSAPIKTGVTVTDVVAVDDNYRVTTNQGQWNCRCLVIATGAFNQPVIPKVSQFVSSSTQMLTSHQYKNPDQLDSGKVLVVGASATGLQLASEIQASGRQVTLATGEHVRMPRTYRGKDIFWWMQQSGISGEALGQVDDVGRVRSLPSPQLIGSNTQAIFDINALLHQGVTIAGRLMNVSDSGYQFSGSLHNVCQLADLKMARLLKRFDQWAAAREQHYGIHEQLPAPEHFARTQVPEAPPLQIAAKNVGTIIWATGYRPDYSWLHLPVLNRKGRVMHNGGVVQAPGVYVIGLPFLRRRNSSFIHGIADDAGELAAHLSNYLLGEVKSKAVGFA